MILENWQIKVLQYQLLDYEAWISHVENYPKFTNNHQEIIENKIKKSLERMLNDYSYLDFDKKNDEEKINLIILQQDYKDRSQRDELITI